MTLYLNYVKQAQEFLISFFWRDRGASKTKLKQGGSIDVYGSNQSQVLNSREKYYNI